MPSDWQIQIDGKTYGPFDDARMKALVKQGKITADTLVCIASQGRWVAAKKVKGLFSTSRSNGPTRPEDRAVPPPSSRPVSTPTHEAAAVAARAYDAPPAYDPAPLNYTASPPRHLTRRTQDQSADSTLNVILGLAGAGMLLLGFFCPIVRLPIIGSMSYLNVLGLQLKKGGVNELTIAASLTLLGIIGGVIVAVINRRKLFWWPGVAGAAAALLTVAIFIRIQMDMSRNMDRDLKDNPFRGLAEALAQSVSLDIGIGVILIGTALLIAAAVVPERNG